jgi:hypothetical protein
MLEDDIGMMSTVTKNDALNASFGEDSNIKMSKVQFDSSIINDSPEVRSTQYHNLPAAESQKLLIKNQNSSTSQDYSPGPFVPDEKGKSNFNHVIPCTSLNQNV